MRITAKTPEEFKVLIDFIGCTMSVEQATLIMDAMKSRLAIAQIEEFMHDQNTPGNLLATLYEFNAEMGGLGGY